MPQAGSRHADPFGRVAKLLSTSLRHGAGLTAIGQVLRHRDLATTALYAKVDFTALRAVAHPWPGGAA